MILRESLRSRAPPARAPRSRPRPASIDRVRTEEPVLDRVSDQQQNDEVKGVGLSELALAGEPKRNHQEPVDQDAAGDLLADADSHAEDRMPHPIQGATRAREILPWPGRPGDDP